MISPAWVGDRYGDPSNYLNGTRLLVLGESFHHTDYEPGTALPDYNNELMREYLARVPAPGAKQPLRWLRTFDNTAWALSGKGPEELRKASSEAEVWKAVAFSNYVSTVAGAASRERPTPEQFIASAEEFEETLEQVKPEVVLCWGYNLTGWVLRNHYPELSKPWDLQGEWVDLPRSPAVRLIRMIHPSTGFTPGKWHDVISRALSSGNAR